MATYLLDTRCVEVNKIAREQQEFPDDWSLLDKINFLQRKILLNSILYYKYDENALSDYFYDSISRQLVELHKECIEKYGSILNTKYGYVFGEFDGSTGYDLFDNLVQKDKDHLLAVNETYRRSKINE